MINPKDCIKVGLATIPYVRNKGWGLPGGWYTKNPLKAQRMAEKLNDMRK